MEDEESIDLAVKLGVVARDIKKVGTPRVR